MASPNIDKMDEAKLDPREAVEGHRDHAWGQGPSPQENRQSEGRSQGAANEDGNNILLGLSFPQKLWKIVEDEAFTSVHWNENGDTVIIEEDLFQREVLGRKGPEKVFESKSLKSFIRLMNLYGFSKIRPSNSSVSSEGNRVAIYRNCYFRKNKPCLIKNIKRKDNRVTTCVQPGTSGTPPKKKQQQVAPTRHSPRIRHKEVTKPAGPKALKPPSAQGPSAIWSFKFLGLQSTTSDTVAQHPNGEGTSRNNMLVSMAPAGTDTTGQVPTSHPHFSLYNLVMYLYNTCYSIMTAALSTMALPSDPMEGQDEEEEEGEGSSDNFYTLGAI